MDALSTNKSINGVSSTVWFTPNDWYGVPKIADIETLKKWMKYVWLHIEEMDDQSLIITLRKSIELALSYLQRKEYYLPRPLQKPPQSLPEILRMLSKMMHYSREVDIRASTVLLKIVRAFFKNITLSDSTWNLLFNPLTGDLQTKDRGFAKEIIGFFNGTDFTYSKEDQRFSKESVTSHWRSSAHGTSAEFNATVDFKTLDSQVLKTISQNAYDASEAIKDRSRMLVEVKNKQAMLEIALVLIESWLFKRWVKWEQKWWLFTADTQEWNDFQRSYIKDHSHLHQDILEKLPQWKVKGNTQEREELKITSSEPSFEVQIMITWNANDAWWNANPYYKMKADIDEEIILRGWYITKDRAIAHIVRRLPDLKKFGQNPEEKTPEKIFEHFVQWGNKLIPIYPSDYKPPSGQNPSHKHTQFFTNSDFTSRGVNVYRHNLPYKVWHQSTRTFSFLNTVNPSPSSTPSSS